MTNGDQTCPDPRGENPNRSQPVQKSAPSNLEHLARILPRPTEHRVEYVTAADVHDRWPDVKPALLRLWVHRGLLEPVKGPDGQPVRTKGARGLANLYRWDDVVEAERRARAAGTGRPRRTST